MRKMVVTSRLPAIQLLLVCFLLFTGSGCGVNPVTGDHELQLVSTSSEVNIGSQNYQPAQQAQGGQYVVDKELTAYVSRIGQTMVKLSDRPELPYEFVVLNNSIPNAWALPGGKIAINRGLLVELENEAELAAVLAHEIVHAAARHGAKSIERGMLLQAGTIGVGLAVQDNEYADLIVGAAAVSTTLVNQKYSREQESESDLYGMKYMAKAGYDLQAAVTLQEKFVRMQENHQQNWIEGLFASHPPSRDRVQQNIETAGLYPEGGRTGEEEYRQHMASLFKSRQAYGYYDEGVAAVRKGLSQEALPLARKAAAIEPREALFYGLQGDSLFLEKQYSEAVQYYNQALQKNGSYYLFYQQRGLAALKLGKISAAKNDLEKSNTLLETAVSHHALGEIALQQNNRAQAQKHFSAAAGAQSSVGRLAAIELAKLELPAEPQKYVAVAGFFGRNGRLAVTIINKAPVAVKNIALDVHYIEARRSIAKDTVFIQGPLAAGAQIEVQTRLPLPSSQRISVQGGISKAEIQ